MKTYEEIADGMKQSFYEQAGYSPDEASDIGIRMRVLAGEIYNMQTYLEWIKRQAFPQTAKGEYLDYHAQMRGLERKEAVKSAGTVEFSISQETEMRIDIPQGTIVSTGGEYPVSFETTEYACINQNETSVSVAAQAVEGGLNGNIASGKISVIVTVAASDLSVTNPLPFRGGSDREDDETLRERIINSLKFIINGTNREYYASLAKTVSGVECVNVVPYKFGAGTVVVYISGKNSRSDTYTVNAVRELLEAQREVNVHVFVIAASLKTAVIDANVTLEVGYDIEEVQEEVSSRVRELTESYDVGKSLSLYEINDILYHTDGIKEFEVVSSGTTGITAASNEKIVLGHLYLRG